MTRVQVTLTKPKYMLCMGEHEWMNPTPMRCFMPSDGSLCCEECGWYQESVAGGCYELCMSASWHDWWEQSTQDEYNALAARARNGGFDPPNLPPNRTSNRAKYVTGQRVNVRLDTPGPGGPPTQKPRDVERYQRSFTRVVDGVIVRLPGEPYQGAQTADAQIGDGWYAVKFELTPDNLDDWLALMPDYVQEWTPPARDADMYYLGDEWIDYEINPAAIEGLAR